MNIIADTHCHTLRKLSHSIGYFNAESIGLGERMKT